MKNSLAIITILFTLLSFNTTKGQGFIYGVYLDEWDATNAELYKHVDSLKMNTILQNIYGEDATQKGMLEKYNLVVTKSDSDSAAVFHYSNGYYTNWEAEKAVSDFQLQTGLKPWFGDSTFYIDRSGWTTGAVFDTIKWLLTGPHYRQDKKYKMNYMNDYDLEYTLRATLAGREIDETLPPPGTPVCKISVVFSYYSHTSHKIENDTLKELIIDSDALTDGQYQSFDINYTYPERFIQYNQKISGLNQYNLLDYDDTQHSTGIQFKVLWYGGMELIVDKLEVFDGRIGIKFIEDYPTVHGHVTAFANRYDNWDNILYHYNINEPQTIDKYTPAKMVDEILSNMNPPRPKGLAEFYPQWEGMRNGDYTIQKFKEMASPSQIMMEFISYETGKTATWRYEQQRGLLQGLHNEHPDFWYEPLIGEPRLPGPDSVNCWLEEPSAAELNGSIMLALAHGAKGVIVWKMTHGWTDVEFNCENSDVYWKVLMERNNDGSVFYPNSLYYYFKNSFGPRITGVLGETLMKLNYSRNYEFLNQTSSSNGSYLRIFPFVPRGDDLNFHAGLLNSSSDVEEKYFLLTNLIHDGERMCDLSIQNSFTSYRNIRVKNVEGGFDTSFYSSTLITQTLEAGEGRLYQVAPVVKYGGTVITNDTIKSNLTVNMNLTLTDTIFINTDKLYTINAPIDLQNGGFITGNGYIKSDSNFVITTNSWSRALLKGRVGNYPKLYWGSHPTISQMNSFKIYRKKQTPGFVHIATVPGNSRSYIDSTVIITNQQPNLTTAEYYIVGVYAIGKSQPLTTSTDTIKYHQVNGTGLEKDGTDQTERITEYKLEQNYPNPFNPVTTITYQIKEKGFTTLKIYDLLGKLVTTLVNEEKENGKYSVEFNASKLSSGVYIYEMRSGNFLATKKFIMLK
jgi:hypothetical protein